MIIPLLKQNLQRIRRSPEFQKRLATNIILGILIAISMANFLILSLSLPKIFRTIPGSNPIKIINEIAFIYFPVDYILRLIFQKYRSVAIKPYLVLNIPREKIVDLILVKTSQSLFNIVPFMLFLPFAMTEMVLQYSWISVTGWFLTILFACFLNAYLANFTKTMFRIYPLRTFLVNGAVLAIIIASAFFLPAYPRLWSVLMKVVLQHPYLCITPLVAAMLMFQINHRLLFMNLFIEEGETGGKALKSREKELNGQFSFLANLGEAGKFVILELKMVLRNKRPKPLLFMSFLMVFYGLLFYSNPINDEIFKVFVGSFMTGVFIFSYGIIIFGWESSYFGFIMSGRINFLSYLRAKYYFMAAVTFVLYILTTFYVIFGIKILFIHTAMFLFNIGITPFIILFIATFNKMRYSLNEGLWSQQGRGTQQYIGSLIVFGLQIGLLILFRMLLNFDSALIIMGLLGFAGILLHTQILSYIEKFFYIKKYSMIEGFRKT